MFPPFFAWRGKAALVFVLLVLAALGCGAILAAKWWWTSDDAFISFRYARNLAEGMGLVFNRGERVEGYTNFLWTLWVAAGLDAGFGAEAWANSWGVVFYLASILLLAANQLGLGRRLEARGWILPLAALGAGLHQDWAAFATGGLETSLFAFLLLCGFMLTAWSPGRPAGIVAAGFVFGLASLTRPDGLIPAFSVGLFLIADHRGRMKPASLFAASFMLLWVPFIAWRLSYYGDIVPNSYYAKSGGLAWYGQGLRYLQLYLERYWALLLGPMMLIAASVLDRRGRRPEPDGAATALNRQAALAAAIAVPYILYVVRVGGDFMFARLLIPVTPMLLVILEVGWNRLFVRRRAAGWSVAALVLAALLLTPAPVDGIDWRYGIANEPMYYSGEVLGYIDRASVVLGRFFEGLPVHVVFYGEEARLAYKARFAVAIEGETALTEPMVARQPLTARGRVGHEKPPSARYLIVDRKADFTFSRNPQQNIELFRHIPDVRVRFDDEVYGQLLRWNPEILDALYRRGAIIQDFPGFLDAYISRIDSTPPRVLAEDYARFKLFYFDQVADPRRETAFVERLPR